MVKAVNGAFSFVVTTAFCCACQPQQEPSQALHRNAAPEAVPVVSKSTRAEVPNTDATPNKPANRPDPAVAARPNEATSSVVVGDGACAEETDAIALSEIERTLIALSAAVARSDDLLQYCVPIVAVALPSAHSDDVWETRPYSTNDALRGALKTSATLESGSGWRAVRHRGLSWAIGWHGEYRMRASFRWSCNHYILESLLEASSKLDECFPPDALQERVRIP